MLFDSIAMIPNSSDRWNGERFTLFLNRSKDYLSAQICLKPTEGVNTKIKLTTAVYLAKDSFDWDVPFSKSIRDSNISDFLKLYNFRKTE